MFRKLKSTVDKLRSKLHEKKKSKHRSPQWDHVRDSFLAEHPKCAACGSSEELQVHHIIPYHVEASRELDVTNLITLCMGVNSCHLYIGHGGSFLHYNPDVVHDARVYSASFFRRRDKIIAEIKKKRKRD